MHLCRININDQIAEEDILLKPELEDLEKRFPSRFKVYYLLDKAPKDSGWVAATGYVTSELLRAVLPSKEKKDIKIFVCGPPGLYKSVSGGKKSPSDQGELTGILKDLGYNEDQVCYENDDMLILGLQVLDMYM